MGRCYREEIIDVEGEIGKRLLTWQVAGTVGELGAWVVSDPSPRPRLQAACSYQPPHFTPEVNLHLIFCINTRCTSTCGCSV